MNINVLLVGALGQLGQCITEAAPRAGWNVVGLDLPGFSLVEPGAIEKALDEHRPDLVINASGYTQVDLAESQADLARQVNCQGPGDLARACREAGIGLVHISTDYVFDGRAGRPYTEMDEAIPLSQYGLTKLEGERAVLLANPRSIVLRTAWLFSDKGKNFVKTILERAKTGAPLKVVDDQTGCPTAAADLAGAVLMCGRALLDPDDPRRGLYHFCGSPATTWHGLAQGVLDLAEELGGYRTCLEPQSTACLNCAAARPVYSEMSTARFLKDFPGASYDWRAGLRRVVERLLAEEAQTGR